jgi:hypothetical protein
LTLALEPRGFRHYTKHYTKHYTLTQNHQKRGKNMSKFFTKQEAADCLKIAGNKQAVQIMRRAMIKHGKVNELRDGEMVRFFGFEREGVEKLAAERLQAELDAAALVVQSSEPEPTPNEPKRNVLSLKRKK